MMHVMMKAAVATFGLMGVLYAPNAPLQGKVAQLEGKKAPAFSMKDISGKTHTNKSMAGKVVLLDFWATWCGPCKKASPFMQALHTKHAKTGLVVVGANGWESKGNGQPDVNNPSYAKKYAAEHKYTYTFTYGNDKLMKDWGLSGIPTFVLIDRKGVVRKVWVGFGDSSMTDMENWAKKLLAEK